MLRIHRDLFHGVAAAALSLFFCSGCESDSPLEASGQKTAFSQAALSFDTVRQFAPGTKMELHLNRSGTEVQTVTVTFIETYVNGDERLILAEAPEEIVVGAGDSGSPLAEPGGKIAGILCYGYYGNNRLFFARAIEDVLAVGSDGDAFGLSKEKSSQMHPAVPLGCSYVLSGHSSDFSRSSEVPNRMKRILQQSTVQSMVDFGRRGAGKRKATNTDRLVPGMSIAIDEVVGDVINFYAVGTISYIQPDALFAFGHGYWVQGNSHVAKPVKVASMKHMVETNDRSFKLAERTVTHIGSFTKDDHDAILITPDTVAQTIGVTTNIQIHDGKPIQYSHRISYDQDKSFEEWLLRFTVMSSMDKCLNNHYYWGNGKAAVKVAVAGDRFDTTVVCTSQVGYPDSTVREASFSRIDDHEDLTAELTDRIVDFVYSKVENPFTLENVVVTAELKPDTVPRYHHYDDDL